FSSRRRHTRSTRDWSSDVCSSDLIDVAVFTFDPDRRLRLVNRTGENLLGQPMDKLLGRSAGELGLAACYDVDQDEPLTLSFPGRSEERRVGKECRCRWTQQLVNEK